MSKKTTARQLRQAWGNRQARKKEPRWLVLARAKAAKAAA